MRRILLFLVLFPVLLRAEYDSTLTLACKQKFAIDENVVNGDYVGYWKCAVSYRSGTTITYSISNNFNNAFTITKIDDGSARITVSDNTYINGKIVAQDTAVNIIIRTTDGSYSELDTAEIWIKESSYCKYIDYSAGDGGTGTRASPYNSFSDITFTAGIAYFVKRGTATIQDKTYNLAAVNASATNPTIISDYGTGDAPHFDGNGLGSQYYLFYFTATSNHVKVYDLYVSRYPGCAFEVRTGNSYFGFYNCLFYNNVNEAYSYDLADIYFFGSVEGLSTNRYHECINITSTDTRGAIVKCDASGVSIYNAYCDNYDDSQASFRIATRYDHLKYFYVKDGSRGVHFKDRECSAEEGFVENCACGVEWLHDTNYPDRCTLSNVKINNCTVAIRFYGVGIDSALVRDCFVSNATIGVHDVRGGTYRRFFNNLFRDCTAGFQEDNEDEPPSNMWICYNIFEAGSGDEINISEGSTVYIYNNYVDGDIECGSVSGDIVKNNFYRTLTSVTTESNNIDLDGITINDYFESDYQLKSTALSAIDLGVDWGQDNDYFGSEMVGSAWDIGVDEYQSESAPPDEEEAPAVVSNAGGYDSLRVMSVNQKYAIREAVVNAEEVGRWYLNPQYRVTCSNTVTYQISSNYYDAFTITKIDNDSARIIIDDYTHINGKIVAKDTTIKIAITVTDVDRGVSETDTAYIKVIEHSSCVLDDLSSISAGHGYFIERGTVFTDQTFVYTNVNGTDANEIVIGAYGNGAKPIFNGSGLNSGSSQAFLYFDNASYTPAYISVYDMDFRNQPYMGIYFDYNGHDNGVYNCDFNNNTRLGIGDLADIYFVGSDYSYVYVDRNIEIINMISINPGECAVKTDESGLDIYNIYVDGDGTNDGLIRFSGGGLGGINCGVIKDGTKGVQIQYPRTVIENCIIDNCGSVIGGPGGLSFETDGSFTPDTCAIRNCELYSNTHGVDFYNSAMSDSVAIEDCFFNGNTNGIWFRNIQDYIYVDRCTFSGNGDGIQIDNSGTGGNIFVRYSVFYGATGYELDINGGSNYFIYNNVIDGIADATGASTEIGRNNYFKTMTSVATMSNNLDIDTLVTSEHFSGYSTHNYFLKNTAYSALNLGYNWGQSMDHYGNTMSGSAWDIGAYEYQYITELDSIAVTDTLWVTLSDSLSGSLSDTVCIDTLYILEEGDYIGWSNVGFVGTENNLEILLKFTNDSSFYVRLDSIDGEIIVYGLGENTTECYVQNNWITPIVNEAHDVYIINNSASNLYVGYILGNSISLSGCVIIGGIKYIIRDKFGTKSKLVLP